MKNQMFPEKKHFLNLHKVYLIVLFFCSLFRLLRITLYVWQKEAFCGRSVEAKRKNAQSYDVIKNEKQEHKYLSCLTPFLYVYFKSR